MHTWDLARATGQDDQLDLQLCAGPLGGIEPLEDVIPILRTVRCAGTSCRRR